MVEHVLQGLRSSRGEKDLFPVSHVHFFLRKDVSQMQEALEKIQQAEKHNQELLALAKQKVHDYNQQQQATLARLQKEYKAEVARFIQEKEAEETNKLAARKESLASEVATMKKHLADSYEKNAQAAIAQVIEKVLKTYGSH